ncbi:AAA family ATPase [Nocardiopsis dassonvillei]|uniref:AAA family ATPase n=1 Tax=Nocardiopsis dassonvillei TaxID=2014 RepID=UPI00200BFF6E|nr:AAA family ATPase [Nocardiopsis dassonvillei]MCK9870929.1 AAA family ATPase [Nocardiopsis dassonvillei]
MDFVVNTLNDGLLPDGYRVDRVDSDGLWLTRGGNGIALQELSDGYRTVAALVLDLIRQIHTEGGDHVLDYYDDDVPTPVIYEPGVILIDEIDVHLHVSWQKTIGGWLKRHFPNMQFIVSSHSPYICQSADPGGLIRLPGVNEDEAPRVVSEDLYQRIVYGSGDDALLTDLFGIDTPYSEEAERKRRRLGSLELAVMRGTASEEERREYVELNRTLNSSLTARVDEVASRLGPEA